MASHGATHDTGPATIEAVTEDKEKMWATFTAATTGTVIFLVILLILMAVFLL
jgi:hypothetical protein